MHTQFLYLSPSRTLFVSFSRPLPSPRDSPLSHFSLSAEYPAANMSFVSFPTPLSLSSCFYSPIYTYRRILRFPFLSRPLVSSRLRCSRVHACTFFFTLSSALSVLAACFAESIEDHVSRFSGNFSRNLAFRSIRQLRDSLYRDHPDTWGMTGDDGYRNFKSHGKLLPRIFSLHCPPAAPSLCRKLSHTRPHNLSHNKLSRPAISATRSDAIGIICYGRGCGRVERWTNRGNQCRSPLGGAALGALRELQMRFCI